MLQDHLVAWNIQPSIWVPLVSSAVVYGWGIHIVWRRAGAGRAIIVRRSISFLGAILALVVTLMSPLDALSDDLFSAHMTQHLILILVVAPLLVMSDVPMAILWVLPRPWAQSIGHHLNKSQTIGRLWHGLSNPVFAWLLFTAGMWLWHAPLLYEAALRSEAIHTLEHVSFLVTAMLFWWVLLKSSVPNTVRYGVAIPYLFLTILQSGILGALMMFTSEPWYSHYAASVVDWGRTPLQDQQLAGVIMWVPVGTVFTLLTIGYFAAWLRALDKRSGQLQRSHYLQARQEPEKKAS